VYIYSFRAPVATEMQSGGQSWTTQFVFLDKNNNVWIYSLHCSTTCLVGICSITIKPKMFLATVVSYNASPIKITVPRVAVNHRSQSYDFRIYNYVQRPRCSRIVRFFKTEEFFFQNALGYSRRCKLLQRWRCKSRS
jgi:hypothetical protein